MHEDISEITGNSIPLYYRYNNVEYNYDMKTYIDYLNTIMNGGIKEDSDNIISLAHHYSINHKIIDKQNIRCKRNVNIWTLLSLFN